MEIIKLPTEEQQDIFTDELANSANRLFFYFGSTNDIPSLANTDIVSRFRPDPPFDSKIEVDIQFHEYFTRAD